MRERKKTAVHGTLTLTYMAVEFNFQQVLLKTLIPTMNTLKDTAVLNIIGYEKNEPVWPKSLKSSRILPFGLGINKYFVESHML